MSVLTHTSPRPPTAAGVAVVAAAVVARFAGVAFGVRVGFAVGEGEAVASAAGEGDAAGDSAGEGDAAGDSPGVGD